MYPGVIQIETTNRCNAKCTMCPIGPQMTRSRGIMDLKFFTKIVKQCQGKVQICHPFLNGEALLVPNILEYFAAVKNSNLANVLFTNASLLTENMSREIIERELLHEIVFSIDGADKETYEAIRIGLNWDVVRENVSAFIRIKKELGAVKPKIFIQGVSEEKELVEKMKKIWSEKDATLSRCPPSNFAGQLDRSNFKPKKNYCPRLYSHLTVLVDGRCALCCFDFDCKVIIGDLNKQSVEEVWDGEILADIRQKIKEKRYDELTLCAHCSELGEA